MALIAPRHGHAGVDEAGRGPLAGPVSAAAVILHPKRIPDGLNDSKKLTEACRERLFVDITRNALAVSVAFSCNREIDLLNIRGATLIAMARAVFGLSQQPRHVWVDGRDLPPAIPVKATAVIDGDALHASIAAASIVAKVMRDRKMRLLDGHFPHYGFAKHKGYPTKEHLAALERFGPSVLHRTSFAPVRRSALRFEKSGVD